MARTNTIEILIKASDQASGAISGMMKSVESSFNKAGANMIKTGAALGLATAPVVAGFASAVNAASAFDESMTNVGAVLGKSKGDMAALNAEVLAIGAASRAGPQAASEAFYDIVGGVADASTHMAILEAAIATAEAGSADLGGTTSALIAIMNSYGFSADQAAFASDVLTQTVGAGVGSMEEFAAAMPQVAGLASSLGVDFTDLGASMAFLTTKGFSASQSATQLRAMMVAMLNPNAQLAKSLEEVGFASGSAAIEQLGLVGAYNLLNSESPTFQSNMAGAVGSVEALNGVISLTDDSFQAFSEDFAASAEGATDAARKIQLDSFAAQMDILNSSVEALRIQIGMALLPMLTRLVRNVQPVVQGIISWAQRNPVLIQTISKITGGVALLSAGLVAAGTAFSIIGGIIGVLVSPIGLVAAAFVLLGLAIKENFLGIGDIFRDILGVIKGFAGEIKTAFEAGGLEAVGTLILDKIKSGLGSVVEWAKSAIITPIKSAFDEGGVEGVGTLILEALTPTLTSVASFVSDNILSPISAQLTPANAQTALAGAQAVGGAIRSALTTGIGSISAWVQNNVISRIVSFLNNEGNQAAMRAAAESAAAALKSALTRGIGSIAAWARSNIIAPIETFLSNESNVQGASFAAGELMRKVLESMGSAIGSIASWVNTNLIQPLINQLTGGGGDSRGGGGASGAGTSLGQKVLDGIKMAFFDMPKYVLENIITPFVLGLTGEDNLASVGNSALGIGEKVIGGILEGFPDFAQWILDNLITPIGNAIKEKLTDILNFGVDLGKNIVDGIIKGLTDNIDTLKTKIIEMLSNALPGWARKALESFSPSMVFADIGRDIPAGLAVGIDKNLQPVASAISTMVGTASNQAGGALSPMTTPTLVPSGGGGGSPITITGPVTIQTNDDPASAWDKLEAEARRRNREFAPRAVR